MTEDELVAALFNPQVEDASRFRGLSLEELEARPEPEWIVYRVLAEDCIAMLEGPTASLKTFVALGFSYSIATGADWLGRPVRQGRVLYLLGEGARGLPRRARAWQIVNLGGPRQVDELKFVVDQMPQMWRGDAEAVLVSNPGPWRLIVVDTLARSMVGGDENSQKDMGLLVAGCEELRRATGACVCLLHHLNAAGNSRGSTALPAGIHTQLRLSREPNSRTATLIFQKQKDDQADPPIVLVTRVVELGRDDDQGQPITSLVLESPYGATTLAQPKLSEHDLTALAALEPKALNFTDWKSQTAMALTTFRRTRHRLLQFGYVAQVVALYAISKSGQNVLRATRGHIGAKQQMALGQEEEPQGPHPLRGGPMALSPDRNGTRP
jgi:hypothetical protein